jgi:hypothetical protein
MNEELKIHDRQVSAVTAGVAKLLEHLAPSGFSPEAIFEGAVRGGAIALLAGTPATAADIASLLEAVGDEFRNRGKPNLKIVQ